MTGRRALAASLVLAGLAAVAGGAKPRGPDVHRSGGGCEACHTGDSDALHADPARARTLVFDDIEARCRTCHGDEGPSHKTGVVPKVTPPEALPLSSDGKITCATCHYMHGEHGAFESFCRIDNSRGALCLTCHQLSELE